MIQIPEGYRLISEEDKKRRKPAGTKMLDLSMSAWINAAKNGEWADGIQYIVPEETTGPRNKILFIWTAQLRTEKIIEYSFIPNKGDVVFFGKTPTRVWDIVWFDPESPDGIDVTIYCQ